MDAGLNSEGAKLVRYGYHHNEEVINVQLLTDKFQTLPHKDHGRSPESFSYPSFWSRWLDVKYFKINSVRDR
jgi:hypothetical protein